MKFNAILGNLLGFFKRDDLVTQASNTRNRIRDTTLTSIVEVQTHLNMLGPKPSGVEVPSAIDVTKQLNNVNLYRNVGESLQRRLNMRKENLFEILHAVNEHNYRLCDKLIDLIPKYFTDKVDKDALTYPRVQVLGLIDSIDFVSAYTRRLCRFIMLEVGHQLGGPATKEFMTPSQLRFVNDNMVNFTESVSALMSTDEKSIQSKLQSIPNVVVTEENNEKKMFDDRKLDPTGVLVNNYIRATWSPGYWIGMAIVNLQHSRYMQAKEEYESLKITLDYFQSLQAGNGGDVVIEKQMIKIRERLDKLDYEIETYVNKAMSTTYA